MSWFRRRHAPDDADQAARDARATAERQQREAQRQWPEVHRAARALEDSRDEVAQAIQQAMRRRGSVT